jgi:ATP-binding protein involved in chromosome partitioning
MKNIEVADIRQDIGGVMDPDIGLRLEDLDAVKDIRISGNLIEIDLELIQPIHWVAERVNIMVSKVMELVAPDYETEINFTEKPSPEVDRDVLKGVKNIIAVSSGKGGVGKSAIAANLAAALSVTGASVGILDGDVYGPSQPTMFDLEGKQFEAEEGTDGKPKAVPLEQYGIKVASMGFIMNKEEAAIVRGPMLAGYFSLLFEQINWGPLDFLIFDLPPGTGDIQLTLTQRVPLTGAVVVTTPQEISVADVRRSVAMFEKVKVNLLGIIENMSYFVPPDMPDKKYHIFGEGGGKKVAAECNVDFLGEVPIDMKMRELGDGGKPIVLAEDCGEQGRILKGLAGEIVAKVRNLNYAKLSDPGLDISI